MRFTRIDRDMENLVAETVKYFSTLYLAELRKLVAAHNTKNHTITITAAMGFITVNINGVSIDEYVCKCWHRSNLLDLLNDMAMSMKWEWAQHLDGERLN